MALFNKLDKPLFLKEEGELKYYILKLKELYEKSEGALKDKIEKEIKIATLGEIGENNIAFELKNSNIPMYVIHDVNLEVDGISAQIDYIVVTRKATIIIECKNLIGNIEINSQGNFIRTYNLNKRFVKEGVYSPVTQNQRHLEVIKRIGIGNKNNIVMKKLFEKAFYENYISIVVLANPKTCLNYKEAPKEVKDKVIRADQLIQVIKKINLESRATPFNDEDLRKQAEKLLSYHKSEKISYLNKYKILLEEVEAYNKEKLVYNKEINLKEKSLENKVFSETIVSNNKDQLIKDLKDFRIRVSKNENVKPYFIFNDKQMMDLIEKMPINNSELLKVSGFGEIKVNKYGKDIIEILNKKQ